MLSLPFYLIRLQGSFEIHGIPLQPLPVFDELSRRFLNRIQLLVSDIGLSRSSIDQHLDFGLLQPRTA